MQTSQPFVVLLSQDLFLGSRIEGAAAQAGLAVATAASVGEAAEHASRGGCRGILLDLAAPGVSAVDLMSALAAERRVPVIAYGPHVATGRLEEAREAGCDRVLVRGQFMGRLAEILEGLRDGA